MNSSDFDEPRPDPRLRDGVRSLPIPETPPALESRVRRRLQRQRTQRGARVAAPVLALVVALFVWRPWVDAPVVQNPQPQPPSAPPAVQAPSSREIPADELAVLFAPPPVESLSVLDRQDRGFVAALNRLEDAK
jgi:hypothetical protein